MNETGKIIWELALCLLLAWIVIFLCLIKGVKSSGKVRVSQTLPPPLQHNDTALSEEFYTPAVYQGHRSIFFKNLNMALSCSR